VSTLWDVAILRVTALPPGVVPLPLASTPSNALHKYLGDVSVGEDGWNYLVT
jgi:hypothetical protein